MSSIVFFSLYFFHDASEMESQIGRVRYSQSLIWILGTDHITHQAHNFFITY